MVTLGDICKVITGGEVPLNTIKGQMTPSDDYPYPVYANGKETYGYSDAYEISEDAVCISSIGANTGAVFFKKGQFTPAIRLKVLIPQSQNVVRTKYLYYIVSVIDFRGRNTGSVPNINAQFVKTRTIPLPSLEEQDRIIDILDSFEALSENDSYGIPAELRARKQQYEFIREQLFSFKEASVA